MTLRRATVPILALLAACAAAPREPAPRGPEGERVGMILKQLFTLQMAYQARNGRFATSMDELRTVGWEDQDTGRYRPVTPDPGSRLCVAMLSTTGAPDAWSMSGEGVVHRGPRCGR